MAHIRQEEGDKAMQNNEISSFIAPYSEAAPTKEELDRRSRQYDRLMALGINPTLIDDTQVDREREDPYVIQAMLLINQDKDVPEELAQKVRKYNQKIQRKNKNNGPR